MRLPDDFYHHAPILHLAFIIGDPERERIEVVTTSCRDFEEGLTIVAQDLREHGWDLSINPVHFLGFYAS